MKHKIIELDNRGVYVVNIPTYDDEGTISTQDAIILRLYERLEKTNLYLTEKGVEPYETPIKRLGEKVLGLMDRAKNLLNKNE